jgi:hypothetical protein
VRMGRETYPRHARFAVRQPTERAGDRIYTTMSLYGFHDLLCHTCRHLIVTALTCIAPSLIFAQAPEPGRQIYRSQLAEVDFRFEKTSLLVGEPLVLILDVKNVSKSIPHYNFSSRMVLPQGNDLEVHVQKPGGVEFQAEGSMERNSYPSYITQIANGQSVRLVRQVLYEASSPSGYLFDKPGPCRVRARCEFKLNDQEQVEIAIPPTQITVTAPTGDAARAFEAIAKPEIARALDLGFADKPETLKTLQTAAAKYPQTLYGRICLQVAALSLAAGDNASVREAISALRKFSELYPDDPSMPEIVHALAMSHHRLKDYEAARAWINHLQLRFPDSTYLRNQFPLYEYYVNAPAKFVQAQPWYLMEKPWIVPTLPVPTNLAVSANPSD